MTNTASDITIRPLAGPEELGLFQQLSYVLDHEVADDLATGRRVPRWMWVAVRDGRVLARLAWWAAQHGDAPHSLDFFDVDDGLPAAERRAIGLRLLETATAAVVPAGTPRPEYGRFVPGDWREDPAAREAVETRLNILTASGATPLVERLRLEWRPGTPLAEPSGHLTFRPATDRAELLDLMTLVVEGSLDAHTREELRTMAPRESAELMYEEEFASYGSPRAWWRIAELPDGGGPVGFVIPARNNYNAIIAYIGVLPAHRGHGHIDSILAEGTRILAAQDVPRIRAATDLPNVPMANAFTRAGYVVFERAINMIWK
ncbi:GNAT family N-acetyltransferase [Streptomyces sp. NBC_00083]|uniref:GNAT family N-acetyltransferase n=1 Tax=Streptomyces sp. NBC_00083 TaxID=2975647 RepID=UPI00225B9494|nr:GNAT family N-acetyltransferase [Streptomyces sp. NBC_00083]MCX5386333.1 GNAT family N-acetyltransferase [Streptomyces sp. NBC_00083]